MTADVEQEAIVLDRATKAAHVFGVLLNNENGGSFLCQTIGRCQARGPGADDENVHNVPAARPLGQDGIVLHALRPDCTSFIDNTTTPFRLDDKSLRKQLKPFLLLEGYRETPVRP